MSTTPRIDILLDRMKHMSAADISILEAAASGPAEAGLTTTSGSPNDVLWSAMEREGWMTSSVMDLPSRGIQLQIKVFKLDESGRAPVADLLERLRPAVHQANRQNALQRLAPHLDTISDDVTARLVAAVKQADGDGSHIVLALSHIVARIVHRTVKPEDQRRVLQDLARRLEKLPA